MDVTIFNHTFTVSSVAFSIGSFDIYWYGIIIACGFLVAMIYALRRAADFNIKLDPMIDVIIVGTLGAIICARAYYVIFNFEIYKDDWTQIFAIHDGGVAIYGAVIGCAVVGGIMCIVRKIKIPAFFDLVGVGLFLGQSVGRWGNFINQEAFGTNTTLPWGMYSSATESYLENHDIALSKVGITVDPSLPVHPTFLYESIWCLLGFVLLHFYSKKKKFDGEVILIYAAWYGLGRFFIEGLRTDSLYLFNSGIRVSQLVAAVTFIAAVTAIAVIRSRISAKKAAATYSGVFGASDDSDAVVVTVMGNDTEDKSDIDKSDAEKSDVGETEDGDGSGN